MRAAADRSGQSGRAASPRLDGNAGYLPGPLDALLLEALRRSRTLPAHPVLGKQCWHRRTALVSHRLLKQPRRSEVLFYDRLSFWSPSSGVNGVYERVVWGILCPDLGAAVDFRLKSA